MRLTTIHEDSLPTEEDVPCPVCLKMEDHYYEDCPELDKYEEWLWRLVDPSRAEE